MSELDDLARAGQAAPVRVPVPNYDEIVDGARALRWLAAIVAGVGWVSAAGGAIGFVLGIVAAVDPSDFSPEARLSIVGLIPFAAGVLAYGIVCLLAAAVVRMIAAAGLALRDLARNSFHRR